MMKLWHRCSAGIVLLALTAAIAGCGNGSGSGGTSATSATRSPIHHLIVVVGENRSFDNVFATYVPPDPSQKVWNLLSQEIVTNQSTSGTNFDIAKQQQATDTTTWQLSPVKTGPFASLPQPNTTFSALPNGPCIIGDFLFGSPVLCTDVGLDPTSYGLLSDPGTGQSLYYPKISAYPVPDCRYPSDLADGPFSLIGQSMLNNCGTPFLSTQITVTSYLNNTGDPVHRFYQMWQQNDCSTANITADNPSGCLHDLYPWVATTVGWGATNPPTTDEDTYQGGVAMGYYSMAQGDWPIFVWLAENYAISDNYHQPIMGGTGPNSQFIFTGDVYFYTNADGTPSVPASSLIENPDPAPTTNNFYSNDSFGTVDPGSTGVGFTDCADNSQPGVRPIMDYLAGLPYAPFNGGNCAPGHYYQVNNEYPYYTTTGSVISSSDTNEFPAGPAFSVGPQTMPTIGDQLSAHKISWKYYGEGFDNAAQAEPLNTLYCAICNGFQYSTSIMTSSLRNNLVDLSDFYSDVAAGTLPAVSFVKPDTLLDAHPGTSTPPLFEAFVRKIINTVQANPAVWKHTAILITFDEGGGEYDSGYIQPIDFFGDGPRTVMIAVSPYAKADYVDHTYGDHASILKFIEWNWRLTALSNRSRDNLPNPTADPGTPYFPTNSPAIGDLTTMFDFSHARTALSTVPQS